MEHFIEIVTKPDNIPIVGMIFIVAFVTWWGLSQAIRNDRHLERGEEEKVIDEMIR
jgi:uncharacterized membrane protein YwzB